MKTDSEQNENKIVQKSLRDRLKIFEYAFGIAWLVQPFEVLRTQLIVSKDDKKGRTQFLLRTVKEIYKSEGLPGFWRGGIMYSFL